MIKAISSKYCKNNLIRLIPIAAPCQLIISADEIILLKQGDNILVNKYLDHPSRDLFKYLEKEIHIKETSELNYQLFEYNKTYLNFRTSEENYSFQKEHFFKGSNRALWLNEDLPLGERIIDEQTEELTRKEIEEKYNINEYDSMYIVDIKGKILLAYTKKDGYVIKNNAIPTDSEIVYSELRNRILAEEKTKTLRKIVTSQLKNQKHTAKSIDEITNLNIYAPSTSEKYSHILITSKAGFFEAKWIRLEFVEKDKFKLTTTNIPVSEPTVDTVINYSKKHPIENNYSSIAAEHEDAVETAVKVKTRTKRRQRKFEKYLNGIFTLEDFKNHI